MFGFINLNKPSSITSRDCVNRVQRLLKMRKGVGHCGTLDPLATGVLVVSVGRATRLTQFVQESAKCYRGRFQLGVESETEDTEGDVRPCENAHEVERSQLETILPRFVGEIMQVPPRFSALKINGKRAYRLARKGKDIELEPRSIVIHALSLACFEYPYMDLDITCGSGTYVRSLGRDIARVCGTSAVMTSLTRTAVGPFELTGSVSLDALTRDNVRQAIQPPQAGLPNLPTIHLTNEQAKGFVYGTPMVPTAKQSELMKEHPLAVALNRENQLIALVRRLDSGELSPKLNFAKLWLGDEAKTRND